MESVVVYFLIVILSLFNSQAKELLLGSSLDKDLATNLIPCDNSTDCESFVNGECRNHFCECNGTKFCDEKTATVVTKIGEVCKINADCNIEYSECKDDKCACAEGRVGASSGRKCLKIAEALGSTCEEGIQCYQKVPHSGCQNDKCVCQQQMHEYDGGCFRNVALTETCQLPGECSATAFARCTNGKCACKEGYVQNKDANRCLDIPTRMGGPCYEDVQCFAKFGKAFCKQGHCRCVELYQFKFTKAMCVRDMLLGEICQNHTDCHGPEEGDRRSECILGACKCRSEFYEEHGFCTSSEQPCKGVPLCDWFDSEKNRGNCIPGKCECEEERPYCTNSVKQTPTAKTTKAKKTAGKDIGYDDLPPRKIREVMISGVFWTYNIFLYYYWRRTTDEERVFLRKYTFPFLILYFHGFTDCDVHHIWISDTFNRRTPGSRSKKREFLNLSPFVISVVTVSACFVAFCITSCRIARYLLVTKIFPFFVLFCTLFIMCYSNESNMLSTFLSIVVFLSFCMSCIFVLYFLR